MKLPARNFVVRTLSGALFAAVVVGAILLSDITFALLLLVVCVGCTVEFYRMAKQAGIYPQTLLGTVGGCLLLVSTFMAVYNGLDDFTFAGTVVITAVILPFLPFIVELYRNKPSPIANAAVTVMGMVYITLPLCLLMFIGNMFIVEPYYILAYFALIWANDVGAYLVGVTAGRRKLFERISPKKSWEGFFGGIVFTILCSVAVYYVSESSSLVFWLGLAVVISLSGVAGDLVESLFKRSAGIKDSGSILPGHGGFLDRFDALIFSIPFSFVYIFIFETIIGIDL